MSQLEGTTHAPPSAGTSSKLVQFPRISNEDTRGKSATSTRSFPRNLSNCFRFFPSKIQVTGKPGRAPPVLQRKAPRTSTISCTWSKSRMDPNIEASPYKWPHDSSLDSKTTALVVIDMQKDFCSPGGYLEYQQYDITPARNIIPHIQALLTAFRSHGFPIYHTREGHRPDLSTLSSRELFRSRNNTSGLGIGDQGPMGRLLIRGEEGHDIVDELTPLEGENVIDKPGRSAFQHTDFRLMLNIKGIKNLVICGVTTDVCVHSTLREANDNGFDCVLVSDASAASTGPLHEFAIESIKEEGGIFGAVTTSDKIMAAFGLKQDVKSEVAANSRIPSTESLKEVGTGKTEV